MNSEYWFFWYTDKEHWRQNEAQFSWKEHKIKQQSKSNVFLKYFLRVQDGTKNLLNLYVWLPMFK